LIQNDEGSVLERLRLQLLACEDFPKPQQGQMLPAVAVAVAAVVVVTEEALPVQLQL
jgi:hypothetical protein